MVSTQKFPIVLDSRRATPRIKRDGQGDADGGGSEVVVGQARHLREIAHRRFRRVYLPIGIGGEGNGSVPGEIAGYIGQMLRIPGKPLLDALER